jgi:alkylation response protein AidB-like acyl-CoA dehydrogenase
MFPRNESQARLLRIAEELAPHFAERAAAHDRDATFPHENFEELRAAGYFAAPVPEQYGGQGHGLADVALAQLALAAGDGSTALAVGMHLMVVGSEAAGRGWPEPLRERVFHAVVEDGALVNNIAAEPELGSPRGGGRPQTVLEPDGSGGWRLTGHKTFSTLSPALTFAVVYAAVEDGSDEVARVLVDWGETGVRVDETWDAIGMRATGSHDVYFEGVRVSDADFLSRRGPGAPKGVQPGSSAAGQGGAWFPLLVAAANLGVAEAARDYAVDFARTRKPTGYDAPIAAIPHVREQVARMQAADIAARSLLLNTAEDWDEHPEARSDLGAAVAAAKRLATNSAVEIVELAMRIVGGVALHRSEPLERYFRDVRGGLVNPPIEARALEQIAASLLDVPRD